MVVIPSFPSSPSVPFNISKIDSILEALLEALSSTNSKRDFKPVEVLLSKSSNPSISVIPKLLSDNLPFSSTVKLAVSTSLIKFSSAF